VIIWDALGWLLVGVTIWVAAFFRDPIRTTPKGEGLIVAPADGLVTMITRVPPPPELRGRGRAEGTVHPRLDFHERVRRPHQPHADRRRDQAASSTSPASSSTPISTRRARTMSASTSWSRARRHRVGFTQIAGLVARRIVPWSSRRPGRGRQRSA
jgi:phosphatidylserine decarboxylase